jgi:hypothetical protein
MLLNDPARDERRLINNSLLGLESVCLWIHTATPPWRLGSLCKKDDPFEFANLQLILKARPILYQFFEGDVFYFDETFEALEDCLPSHLDPPIQALVDLTARYKSLRLLHLSRPVSNAALYWYRHLNLLRKLHG